MRYVELDIFRGVAVLMMIVFHLLYDLNFQNLTHIPLFQNPFWLVYRETILFLFLGLSGGCLYLVHREQIHWPLFRKRMLRLLIVALLVTVGSFIYARQNAVYFGILHCIAATSLISLALLRHPSQTLLLGILLLAVGFIGDLNERQNYVSYLAWLGPGSLNIRSFDLVPLIPYLGYSLVGVFMMSRVIHTKRDYLFVRLRPEARHNRVLAFLGKHSLFVYLIHQPILVGMIHIFRASFFIF